MSVPLVDIVNLHPSIIRLPNLSGGPIEGMWPFKVDVVTLETSFDIDFDQLWVRADVTPHRIFGRVLIDQTELYRDPRDYFYTLWAGLRDAFRYRERIEPEDNIMLGEE